VWIVLIGAAIGIVFVQRPNAADHQISNIATLVMGLVAVGAVTLWFVCFSGYSFLLRMLSLAAVLLAPVVFFTFFRIEQVTAELVPHFGLRFAPKPDEKLEQPPATVADTVDLTPTSRDFPQFLGPNRDFTVPDITLTTNWNSQAPEKMWRQPIGGGWSGFAAVHGFAVTLEQRGDKELVTCYEIETGKLRWSQGVEARHETVLGGVGPRSTPTIHDGRVYALGATGKLRCLDGATGQLVWSKDLLAEFGVTVEQDLTNIAWGRAGSPLVVDDKVIVPAGGPAGKAVSLVAYHRLTGEEVWRGGERQISYASPTLAKLAGASQVLIVNEDTVSTHDPETGKTLWSHPWDGKSNMNATASQALVLPGDRVFLSKGYAGGSLMLRLSRQGDAWKVQELWQEKNVLKTKLTSAVHFEDHLYGLSDGIFECVAAEDGQRQWKRGRYGHGQPLLVGRSLLVLTESGEVVLLAASPESHQELSRFQAIEGKTWNNLCIYGPYLLVRNGEEAACYKLPLAK
jgi:outer membrane protein assembly factor BamB